MPAMRHVHKYFRVNKSRQAMPYLVYECRLGDCTHFLPLASTLGKRSICWDCGKVFHMDIKSLQIKPRCSTCRSIRPYHKSKVKEYADDINPMGSVDALLDSLLPKKD